MKKPILSSVLTLILASLACGQIITPVPVPTVTVSPVPSTMPLRATQTPLPARETPSAIISLVCNTDALNLRALPGEEFQKIGELERGAEVYVYLFGVSASDGGQWLFVLVDGVGFWVNAKYICEAK